MLWLIGGPKKEKAKYRPYQIPIFQIDKEFPNHSPSIPEAQEEGKPSLLEPV